ncbi:agmatine deiminase family protein [Kitasatospora sp. NPDC091276]|uniref:agmatine deiminase family protein n=1 Tax=unclassified Kitasatospora TaxID=2633591 RepID=UPI00343CC741
MQPRCASPHTSRPQGSPLGHARSHPPRPARIRRYADGVAYAILQAKYPDRTVVQPDIDDIASGGDIHCSTQSQPAVPPAG